MNNLRKKKLAIAFLSVGAVSVWAPMLRSSEPEVRHRRRPPVVGDSQGAQPTPEARTQPRPEPSQDVGGGESEKDLEAMLAFLPTGSPSSLEEAAMVWARESSSPRPRDPVRFGGVVDPVRVEPVRSGPLPRVRPEAEAPGTGLLEAESVAPYLGDRPLRGILRGASGSLALLGGHIVREGDVLVHGVLVVDEIAATHVTLSYRGDRVRLSLPGFRAAPPAVVQAAEPEPAPEAENESENPATGDEDSR